MPIRNRELSQLGSFIEINDSTRSISIASTETPFVGIGTTNPQYKLHVAGNTNISGNLNLDGDLIYNGQLSFGGNVDLYTTGIITASAFYNTVGALLTSFDSWNPIGSNIYRPIGNVGIGTDIPTEKLDVLGNIKTSGQFISSVATGTPSFKIDSQTLITNLNADYLRGASPGGTVSGDIVTIDATQTLTNKTISGGTLSNTPTASSGINVARSGGGTAFLQGPESGSWVITIPAETGTILTSATVGLITSGNIVDGSIQGTDIANSTITNTKLSNSTISGVSLGSSLSNLTVSGSYLSNITYNGSTARTVSISATFANTGGTIVARDASGDFSAATVSVLNLSATNNISALETITAKDFNSTSDINYKENIQTVSNPLELLNSIRGVSFDWKDSDQSSMGVIAQELEKVLPQLVKTSEMKSVNYNGLIAVLIESVKELKKEIEELKNHK